jgi:hypothetical protein
MSRLAEHRTFQHRPFLELERISDSDLKPAKQVFEADNPQRPDSGTSEVGADLIGSVTPAQKYSTVG